MRQAIKKSRLPYLLLVALVGCVFGASAEASAREVQNLDRGWTFFTDGDTDAAHSRTIDLPHTWNGNDSGTTGTTGSGIRATTGNYLKDVFVPRRWQGRRVFLRIGGAATVADVFVNSRHSGRHAGGGTAFAVEITDLVRFGASNNLRVVVDSSPRLDVPPTAGEERIYGGLYRGVEIVVCEPLAISPLMHGADGIMVTTDRLNAERVEGSVHLELLTPAAMPSGARARIRFIDAEGVVAAQNSVAIPRGNSGNSSGGGGGANHGVTLSVPFSIANPRLWCGTADPYMYAVEVTLRSGGANEANGAALDSLVVTTGFRTVGVDRDGNFTLNGEPLKIRGVVLHRDRPVTGTAMASFQIEEDVELIRRMGANAVRVAGGRHGDLFYDLCDRAGLLVWTDGPLTGSAHPADIDFVDTEAFRASGRLQLTETIHQLHNHPSAAMWGIFSNLSLRGDDPARYIGELHALARSLDPSRPTVASSVRDGDTNRITDLISFDLPMGWESGLPDGVTPWLAQLRSGWPDLRAAISYSAGGSVFRHSEPGPAGVEKPAIYGGFHPEEWQAFVHGEYLRLAAEAPGLWGVFVGNMFDFGAANYPWGDGGDVNDHGLATFDRHYLKDAYYLYKAAWNGSEPFVRIAASRSRVRTSPVQTIEVFSNLPSVELFLDGRSLGVRNSLKADNVDAERAQAVGGGETGSDSGRKERTNGISQRGGEGASEYGERGVSKDGATGVYREGERGVFRWEGVEFRPGVNVIEVRARIADAEAGRNTVLARNTSEARNAEASGSAGSAKVAGNTDNARDTGGAAPGVRAGFVTDKAVLMLDNSVTTTAR
ncbi:MAG: glycoside hydrolase family 2 protein [Alistipes sp.]|jgi:beta-galactosidase|nr:glycoside hydrolase family 2 protein [Alistipes sp.]